LNQVIDQVIAAPARLWHPWLGIQRLLRDIAACSASEATPWRAVQRAAWAALNGDDTE
jgi:hypothetical protein